MVDAVVPEPRLLNTFNVVSVTAEALGSIAVASAVFMILEFSQPYSGLFRISPVGVDNLIANDRPLEALADAACGVNRSAQRIMSTSALRIDALGMPNKPS